MTNNVTTEATTKTSKRPSAPEFIAVVLASHLCRRKHLEATGALGDDDAQQQQHHNGWPVAGVPVLYRLLDTLQRIGLTECWVAESQAALDQFVRDSKSSRSSSSSGTTNDSDVVAAAATTESSSSSSTALPTPPPPPLHPYRSTSNPHEFTADGTRLRVTWVPLEEMEADGRNPTAASIPVVRHVYSKFTTTTGTGHGIDHHDTVPTTTTAATTTAMATVAKDDRDYSDTNLLIVPSDLLCADATVLANLLHQHRQGRPTTFRKDSRATTTRTTSGPFAACTVLLTDCSLPTGMDPKACRLVRPPLEDMHYTAVAMPSSSSTNGRTNPSTTATAGRLVWHQPKEVVHTDTHGTGSTPKVILPKARLCQDGDKDAGSGGGILTVRTAWADVHCYCLAPWVVQRCIVPTWTSVSSSSSLSKQPPPPKQQCAMRSIAGDLIPRLVERQYRGVAATVVAAAAPSAATPTSPTTATSTIVTANKNNSDDNNNTDEYSVLAHVLPPVPLSDPAQLSSVAVLRCGTVPVCLYANRHVAQHLAAVGAVHVDNTVPRQAQRSHPFATVPGTTVKPKVQCVLLPDCQLGDKISFKSSVVGRGCTLGTKCRLNNVVLQDGVVIGDNTSLQNTMVSSGSTIAENCSLNDCCVWKATVPSGTKVKGETIV